MSHPQTIDRASMPNKGKRRRVRFLFFTMLCLLAWAAMTFWNQSGEFSANAAKLHEAMQLQAQVSQTNADLSKQIARYNDPEYRAEIYRKQLHLGKPGETTFDISN